MSSKPIKEVIVHVEETFLDASQFRGGDRVNHFLVNALRQLDDKEREALADALLSQSTPAKVFKFNNYQIVNLYTMMKVIRDVHLNFDTGDWFGEIYWKLSDMINGHKITDQPNVTPEIQTTWLKNILK